MEFAGDALLIPHQNEYVRELIRPLSRKAFKSVEFLPSPILACVSNMPPKSKPGMPIGKSLRVVFPALSVSLAQSLYHMCVPRARNVSLGSPPAPKTSRPAEEDVDNDESYVPPRIVVH